MLTYHQVDVRSLKPKEGWVEQNPLEILTAVRICVEKALQNLKHLDIDPSDIRAIGITNQRETVVVWDKFTGQPLYNAIGKYWSRKNVIEDSELKELYLYRMVGCTECGSC